MRDMSLLKETSCLMHGYCVSTRKHLQEIFDSVSEDLVGKAFIDIGCGNGYALFYVRRYGCAHISGIEIDERLTDIANKNMKKLGIKNVDIHTCDARDFEGYGEYDVYFLFNPFSAEIFKPVFDKICAAVKETGRRATLIYYNPTCHDIVIDSGIFMLNKTLYDKERDYTP